MADHVQGEQGSIALLLVMPLDAWTAITEADLGPETHLWALSDEVRDGFAETLVVSRGSTHEAVAHHEVIAKFHEACASLPEWTQLGQRLWAEGGSSYALFTGTTTVGGESLESTSVIGVDTADGTLTAHQVVVTTFADNHGRHLDALEAVRTPHTTVGRVRNAG